MHRRFECEHMINGINLAFIFLCTYWLKIILFNENELKDDNIYTSTSVVHLNFKFLLSFINFLLLSFTFFYFPFLSFRKGKLILTFLSFGKVKCFTFLSFLKGKKSATPIHDIEFMCKYFQTLLYIRLKFISKMIKYEFSFNISKLFTQIKINLQF